MKKLSLLSLLWLTGLFTFFATPIYAQNLADEIVDGAENLADETVDGAENLADEIVVGTENIVNEVADETENIMDEAGDVVDEANDALLLTDDDIDEIFWDSSEGVLDFSWLTWVFAGMWIASVVISLIFLVLVIIALWKAFVKAWEGWWKAIIPIYNTYIMFKIAKIKNWFWYMLLIAFVLWILWWILSDYESLISIISTVITCIISIVMLFKFARKYNRWVFASILFVLFTPICLLILWFWNYKYEWKSGWNSETIVEA